MNVGILTAGGVCPGVNNLIHSLTLYENSHGNRVIGFNEGFRGLNNNTRTELSRKKIEEGAGYILRVSCESGEIEEAIESLKELIRPYCICGKDSMKGAASLALDDRIDT